MAKIIVLGAITRKICVCAYLTQTRYARRTAQKREIE